MATIRVQRIFMNSEEFESVPLDKSGSLFRERDRHGWWLVETEVVDGRIRIKRRLVTFRVDAESVALEAS